MSTDNTATSQKRRTMTKKTTRRPRRVEAPVCTSCGSGDTLVYKTVVRTRYWKCRDCGDTGKISGEPAVTADNMAETVDDLQGR